MSNRPFNNFNTKLLRSRDPRVQVVVSPADISHLKQDTIKYKIDNGPKNKFHTNKGDIEIKKRRILEEGQLSRKDKE